MRLTCRRSLILALASLWMLALSGAHLARVYAPDTGKTRLIAQTEQDALYAGVDFQGAETLLFNTRELWAGLLVYAGPGCALPDNARQWEARNVRGMVGLYIPCEADVALAPEAVYALCALVNERFPTYATVCEGMRSPLAQRKLHNEAFTRYLDTMPAQEALRRAQNEAPVDFTCEHQLPTALDIRLEGRLNWLEDDPLLRNADGIWLSENAHRFGFIRRYPPEKADITGVSGEETHFRYVGLEHARIMRLAGWCLEEYMEALHAYGGLTFLADDEPPVYVLCAPLTADDARFPCPAGYTGTASADNRGCAVCLLTRGK